MVTAAYQLAMARADIITVQLMAMATTINTKSSIIGSSGNTAATAKDIIMNLNIRGNIADSIADSIAISIGGNIAMSIVQEAIIKAIIGPIADIIATVIKPV